MLFKEFADVDAFPICLDTNDPDRIIEAVKLMAPTFGGINLEDISAPRCFYIEETLKEELDIPVFHDDQHGTAVVTMAALFNALKIVGKPIESLRVLIVGPRRGRRGGHEDDACVRRRARDRLRPPGRALDRAGRLPGREHLGHQALVRGELEPRQARGRAERRDRGAATSSSASRGPGSSRRRRSDAWRPTRSSSRCRTPRPR